MSAFSLCPGKGSEFGRGFEIANRVAQHHLVWAITRSEFKEETEAHFKLNPQNPNLTLVYFDIPLLYQLEKFLHASHLLPFSLNIYYYFWQIGLFFFALSLHKKHQFNLSHHVTWTRFWMPSLLAFLPIPFVLGTVGGADLTPPKLLFSLPIKSFFFELIRALALKLSEFDPLLRLSLQRTKLALAMTPSTQKRLIQLGAKNVKIFTEIGLGDELDELSNLSPALSPSFRVLSVSRLAGWKGLHLSIQAFAQLNDPQAEYWIFGKGPEEKRLKQLCKTLNIEQQVRFYGYVPRADLLKAYANCHVLIHPSLHETGGWATIEAMAAGIPVICLNHGGPAVIVSEDCGIKIEPSEETKTVQAFSHAIKTLSQQADLRKQMGQAAQTRVKNIYRWDYHIHELMNLYKEAVSAK